MVERTDEGTSRREIQSSSQAWAGAPSSKYTCLLGSGARRGRCKHWLGHPHAPGAYGEDEHNVPLYLQYIMIMHAYI